MAIRDGDSFTIELTYGPEVDWYRNVQAAGGCEIVWHGQTFTIDGLAPLDAQTGLRAFPQPFRVMLTLLGNRHFARLHIAADSRKHSPPDPQKAYSAKEASAPAER